MKTTKPESIDAYIQQFPKDIQETLELIRNTVKKAAPGAQETIKYDMPTFMLNGNLVHFGAFKKHIGFYPVPRGVKGFEELENKKKKKSTAQFSFMKPMPIELIEKIVKYRVEKSLQEDTPAK